jgi:uncharacterized protein DUF6424
MTMHEPSHSETEDHAWEIQIPNHPGRQDSPEYVASRRKMNEMAAGATGLIYGTGPFQDHHGGSLWLKDSQGWFMVRNQAGIEWSSQFCASAEKVDLLRQNAKRLYDLVPPEIKQEIDPGGLLDKKITDADGIARWTDSVFNACVPLHPTFHTGVLGPDGGSAPASAASGTDDASAPAAGSSGAGGNSAGDSGADGTRGSAANQEPGGVHHYPTPVADIQLFKHDDFQLWVTDAEGHPAAVAPVARRGSGDSCVHVLYATPGSQLAAQKHAAEAATGSLVLGPGHDLSKQAYQHQTPAAGTGGSPPHSPAPDRPAPDRPAPDRPAPDSPGPGGTG